MGKFQFRVTKDGNDVSIRLEDGGTVLDISEPINYEKSVTPDNDFWCLVNDLRSVNQDGQIAGKIAEYLKSYVGWMYIERNGVHFTIIPAFGGQDAEAYADIIINRVETILENDPTAF